MKKFEDSAKKILIKWFPAGLSVPTVANLIRQEKYIQAISIAMGWLIWFILADMMSGFAEEFSSGSKERGKKLADLFWKKLDQLPSTISLRFSGYEKKYIYMQAQACSDYVVEGFNPAGIFIPLQEEVFVPLKLDDAYSQAVNPDRLPESSGFNQSTSLALLAAQENGISIWQFFSKTTESRMYRQMAILAWGGYGKTTLLRNVAYSYAHRFNTIRHVYSAPKLIPVLLYLRKCHSKITVDLAPPLPKLISDYHLPSLPGNQKYFPPNGWAEEILESGKALIMLDGFDEIPEQFQGKVSEWIKQEMSNYPESTFIVTSRPAGYKNYSAQKPYTTLYVKAFSSKQRKEFIERWYYSQERYVRGGRGTKDVQDKALLYAADLNRQIESRSELSDMSKNPLLLNLIATFHRSYPDTEIPKRRSEIYREICKLQLGGRPLARHIKMLLSADDSQGILQHIALEMMQNNQATISEKEILSLIGSQVSRLSLSVDLSANQYLLQVVEVSELLVQREPHEYEFSHFSFQAYLAACQIRFLENDELLVKNADNYWWHETTLLYASEVNPTSLIEKLCEVGTSKAVSLAYTCLQETYRKIDYSVESRLKKLGQQLQILRLKNLEHYLKERDWRRADEETYLIMLQLAARDYGRVFGVEDFSRLPQDRLHQIDYIWRKHSKHRFGFSIQKGILKRFLYPNGGTEIKELPKDSFDLFFDSIGWKKDGNWLSPGDVVYSDSAPEGHLPSVCTFSGLAFGEDFLCYTLRAFFAVVTE